MSDKPRATTRRIAQGVFPETEESDAALAARIRRGDITAFEILFHRYYSHLTRSAFTYTRSRDAAEDVVQDVMLAVWERHSEFARHTVVAAYLYGAVRNRALDVLAHDAVVQRHAAGSSSDVAPATDELVFATELARITHEEIEALPLPIREVYRLRHDSALSNIEIATTLGISINAVYVRMAKAMRALRAALAPWRDEGSA